MMSVIRKIAAFLQNDMEKNAKIVLSLLLIPLFYVSVLLFYTHGSLLFDGDNYGFYHFTTGMLTTPTGILEAFSLILTGSNLYASFYVYLYISILFAVFSMYYLSYQIYLLLLPKKLVTPSALLSGALYVVTPFILVDYYTTLIGNISLPSSFFTLFLAFLIRSYRDSHNTGRSFTKNIGAASIFLGLGVTPFPNDIRILFVGFVIFLSYVVFVMVRALLVSQKPLLLRNLVLSTPVFFGLAIFSSLFITYGSLTNIGATISSANVAASNFSNLGTYTGSFNTVIWTIRLIDTWSFPTGYVIYHSVYFHLDAVNAASFFWPILSLVIPLIIIYRSRSNRAILLYIMFLTICAIFWEKSANQPLGSLWYYINSKLPYGYELIPNGTLTSTFLAKIYPVLAVFSVITLYGTLEKIQFENHLLKKIKRIAVILVPVLLVSMLVVAEMPVFDGQLEANYYNPQSSGFFIPKQYSEVRNYVMKHPGKVLILPGATTYITFLWNYSGTTYFYNSYFYPVNVTTNQNFGGGYGSVQQVDRFVNLTSPIIYTNNTAHISSVWKIEITELHYEYLLFDKSIIGGQLFENYTYTQTAINLLIKAGYIVPVLNGNILQLYKLCKT